MCFLIVNPYDLETICILETHTQYAFGNNMHPFSMTGLWSPWTFGLVGGLIFSLKNSLESEVHIVFNISHM